MTRRAILLIVLLFASPALAQHTAKAQGQITVVNGQPPPPPQGLGWTDISAQQIQPNCPPDPDPTGSCNGMIDAWSSGWGDTTRNRLCAWGGGHNDYSGNEVYCYDLGTKKLTRLDNPSNPSPTCSAAYSDNTPSSRHNYGGLAYMPNVDRVFNFGSVPFCPGGGFISDTWTLNPALLGSGGTNGWTQSGLTLGNGGIHPANDLGNSQAQYDPNTGLVFVNESQSGFWSYNFGTNSYTHLSNTTSNSLHDSSVIDPNRKLFIFFGDGAVKTISIATGSSWTVNTKVGTGCTALMNSNSPGLQYDSDRDRIIGWPNFGPSILVYNPTADTCTTETYVANAPPDSHHSGSPSTSTGTWGRFEFFPSLHRYALINEWNIDVHELVLSNGVTDFAARCAASGVLRCQQLSTAAELTGNAAPGKPKVMAGLTTPVIDATVFPSAGGSLKLAVPAGATQANSSGSYNIDFKDDFSIQADSLVNGDPLSPTTACGGSPCPNEIYVQWRQRFDAGMLQHFANSNGFKQIIIGEGDQPGFTIFSCTDLELPVENSSQMGIARMYTSCGKFLDEFFPLTTPTGNVDIHGNSIFSPQNQAGGYLNCTYAASINIPTIPPCVPYATNTWMTFMWHLKLGEWYPGGTNGGGGPPAPLKHDSLVELYISPAPGQSFQRVIGYVPGATSPTCDNTQSPIPSCLTGMDITNPTAWTAAVTTPCVTGSTCNTDQDGNAIRAKYGQLWLLNYQTNNNCPACTAGNTWYGEVIVSTQSIAVPKF